MPFQLREGVVDHVVMPGDEIGTVEGSADAARVKLGPGLRVDPANALRVVAVQCGVLRQIQENKFFVESNPRRYVPHLQDMVVGTILGRFGEQYSVDIGSAAVAVLPDTAFDGATRRNKPNLLPGCLVYCRIAASNRDMDPELTCTSASTQLRRDWVTGESLFGELKGGLLFQCSLGLARSLLRKDAGILKALGAKTRFELAVGQNGRLWVNAGSPADVLFIGNALLESELVHDSQSSELVARMVAERRKALQ